MYEDSQEITRKTSRYRIEGLAIYQITRATVLLKPSGRMVTLY